MADTGVGHVARGLVGRGWATYQLNPGESGTYRQLNTAAERFFHAPPQILRLSQWSGNGMWAGYQPMPEGETEVIDQVNRFEVSQALLDSSDAEWPWLSAEARALKRVLAEVNSAARTVVSAIVREVADVLERDADAAHRLWCRDDSSTLVVNDYRSLPTAGRSEAVKMKPHADFGGLTLIYVDKGLDALQFLADGVWEPVTRGQDGADVGVVLIGQLFAHWLGTVAPIHRVIQDPSQSRMSIVYFNQPNLHADIVNENGESINAEEHISTMQNYYNNLGTSPV